jgi:hypothetical protein
MNLSFLDDLLQSINNVGADTDKFMKREMPFDSGWGAPAAAVAAYFGGPALMASLGEGGAAGIGSAEGVGSTAGSGGILGSLGGSGGSFAGQEAFQLPASSYTPDYLNSLAQSQGVDAGDISLLSRLAGNTEQGLYNQENIAQKMSGQTASDMLKKRSQQSALSQLSKGGSTMQQQGQQSPQMQVPQAMMSRGQGVDTVSALLSLLQEKQMLRQPRISLI